MAEGLAVAVASGKPVAFDVAFTAEAGAITAIVGASGAGKTSVLRAIAGLLRPASGTIRCGSATWFDRAARIDLPPQRRRIGLVFQAYALFPHMTALANVMVACGHLASGERRRRAEALLGQLGLADLGARRPAQLSGGQQQRVALARALARDPAALLLDEPFAAIDRPTRRALARDLLALRAPGGMPIVLVTHDIDDAMTLATHLVVIDAGRVAQTGVPAEVAAGPASPAVARLFE